MYVDDHVISEAAKLIIGSIENGLPTEDVDFDEEDTAALDAVLEELNWADLMSALRLAAERLPEPEVDAEDDPDDDED